MILYNVTLHVNDEIKDEWLNWMEKEHLPEVMATGKFLTFGLYKIHNHQPDDFSHNYSVQYHAQSMEDYEDYAKNFGPTLKEKTIFKFGDKVVAFRTILDKLI